MVKSTKHWCIDFICIFLHTSWEGILSDWYTDTRQQKTVISKVCGSFEKCNKSYLPSQHPWTAPYLQQTPFWTSSPHHPLPVIKTNQIKSRKNQHTDLFKLRSVQSKKKKVESNKLTFPIFIIKYLQINSLRILKQQVWHCLSHFYSEN